VITFFVLFPSLSQAASSGSSALSSHLADSSNTPQPRPVQAAQGGKEWLFIDLRQKFYALFGFSPVFFFRIRKSPVK
jgi:hypothetical protein